MSFQLLNDLTRTRKLIRSIESLDPKILAAITKVETNNKLKSDFEEMASCILPCDPVANSKDNSNKNEKHRVSNELHQWLEVDINKLN